MRDQHKTDCILSQTLCRRCNISQSMIFHTIWCKSCEKYFEKIKHSTMTGYLRTVLRSTRASRVTETRMCDLTVDQLVNLWNTQHGRCALTGVLMTHSHIQDCTKTNVSIDRIDSNGDYTIANVQLVCCLLNLCKGTLSDDHFRWLCTLVTQNNLNHVKKNFLY